MAAMGETATHTIGAPKPPPAAVVVAVSGRFVSAVKSARRRQLLGSAGLLILIAGAGAAVIVLAASADATRQASFAVGLAAGASLFVGALVRPRPLELGSGLIARGEKGQLLPVACARGALVLPPVAVRGLVEGFLYGAGFIRQDPAVELAAWIILALVPPHGPGPEAWVSLEGVNAAGIHSLPEDLKAALRALAAEGWVTVDRKCYPPLVRLEADGLEFARTLGSGVG